MLCICSGVAVSQKFNVRIFIVTDQGGGEGGGEGKPKVGRKLTVCVVARIDHSRADAEEQDTLFLVLGAELGGDHIQGGLADGVESAHADLVLADQLRVRHSRGNSHNLLGLALENKG